MISIVNYGVSNVRSMLNMMNKIGIRAEIVSTPEEVERAEKIILPGIGAFDHGMAALNELNLAEPLRKRALQDRIPLLGVCLGMQMLGRSSEEGSSSGLGLLDGHCTRFRSDGDAPLKVPHMGWNEIAIQRTDSLMEGLEAARFYFVHSYHLVCDDPADVLASAHHGTTFTAAVHHENVWGVQFHPEKSHRFGMALLRNFAAI